MGKALFYHLTRSPAERLVPDLVGKSLANGWQVELRGNDPERMDWFDKQLWQGDGFLPHGLAGGPHDARQPVLLTLAGQEAANNPSCLLALDGVDITPQECTDMQRVCIIFDGGNTEAVNRAREQWRILTGAEVVAEYWSEESGRWDRKR